MSRSFALTCSLIALTTVAIVAHAGAQTIDVIPDHADGIYQLNDTVTWKINTHSTTLPSTMPYVVSQNQFKDIDKGVLTLTDGQGEVSAQITQPGTLLLKLSIPLPDGKKLEPRGGAAAALDQLTPVAAPPEDFDAFWAAQLEKLKAIPMNPVAEPDDSIKNVHYERITLDNINGTHIHGQLAEPNKGDTFPALLILQWAGVYPLQKEWVTGRAHDGWMALDIEAHDLPIDKPADYYAALKTGALANYWQIGNEDRETSYFLRMYLSCYRAAEYLKSRPEWNGQTFVVTGGSQGGLQTLMLAGLMPDITAAMALVPAGTDTLGPSAGRQEGWPVWYWNVHDRDAKKVRETSRYYDVINFAHNIKCPVLMAGGLIDETCPLPGVAIEFNTIRTPKKLLVMPFSAHTETHGSQAAYTKEVFTNWYPLLAKGEPPKTGD